MASDAYVFVWELYRDGVPFSKAVSHQHAQRIVTAMKRAYPASSFKAIYIGRNLGARTPEEIIG